MIFQNITFKYLALYLSIFDKCSFQYEQTTVNLLIGDEQFSFSGKKVTKAGFTQVMTWQAIPAEENMPQVGIYQILI